MRPVLVSSDIGSAASRAQRPPTGARRHHQTGSTQVRCRPRRLLITSPVKNRSILLAVYVMRRRDLITLIGAAPFGWPFVARADQFLDRVLYFTHSAGYRHDVLPLSGAILHDLGANSRSFEVTATEDLSVLTAQNLQRYAAIMF